MVDLPTVHPVSQAALEATIKYATGVVPSQLNVTHRMMAWDNMTKETANILKLKELEIALTLQDVEGKMADAGRKMSDAMGRMAAAAEGLNLIEGEHFDKTDPPDAAPA
jgi:hypothetical protein